MGRSGTGFQPPLWAAREAAFKGSRGLSEFTPWYGVCCLWTGHPDMAFQTEMPYNSLGLGERGLR
jgi:hypothetical protein